eukprot:scpid88943/ scgid14468/ 
MPFLRGSKDWDNIERKTFADMSSLPARTYKEQTIRENRSFVVNDNKSKRRSGTEEEFTRNHELLTELASRWRAAEEEKVEAGKAKRGGVVRRMSKMSSSALTKIFP